MNQQQFGSAWKQLRGQARALWCRLTDDDLARASEHSEQLISQLQQNGGYDRQRAEDEINRWLTELKSD